MKLKLNGKNHYIKSGEMLTVAEHIDFLSRIDPDVSKTDRMIFTYISVVAGVEFDDIVKVNISSRASYLVLSFLNKIKLPDQMDESEEFYFGWSGQRFIRKKIEWRNAGVRMLMGERKHPNTLDAMVYLLAILISKNYDPKIVQENYERLLKCNAIDVFSFTNFFFRSFKGGWKSEPKLLRMLKRLLFRNMRT